MRRILSRDLIYDFYLSKIIIFVGNKTKTTQFI
jgi:hypothetical protein